MIGIGLIYVYNNNPMAVFVKKKKKMMSLISWQFTTSLICYLNPEI